MASAYTRHDSRFYWIKFRDPAGKLVSQSTGIDVVADDARRRVKALVAKHTQREMEAPRTNERERWETWVGGYFAVRYTNPKTALSAGYGLRDLLTFLAERGIRTPRMVSYDAAAAFVPWCVKNGLAKNTAILRFSLFRVVMSEAVRRGFCPANVCREVELRHAPSKAKEEISAEDEAKIIAAIAAQPQAMRDQFTVLMRQGCRISETFVPLALIDPVARTIRFRLKGGKMHTAEAHRDVLAIYERAKAEGRDTLVEPFPNPAARWFNLFRSMKLPYSIHCTRVTVITRLARAGWPQAMVSNFIGHTEAVNAIYRKLKPADSRAMLGTLDGAPGPA